MAISGPLQETLKLKLLNFMKYATAIGQPLSEHEFSYSSTKNSFPPVKCMIGTKTRRQA